MKNLTISQLEQLAQELRDDIVHTVSKTGGHLGSSLGVVELTGLLPLFRMLKKIIADNIWPAITIALNRYLGILLKLHRYIQFNISYKKRQYER